MPVTFPSSFTHLSDIHDAQYMSAQELAAARAQLDGYDAKKLELARKGTRLFIGRLAHELKLNPWVEDDALVFVERFFARKSYERNDRFLIAAAALFLAAKLKDSTRSVRHVAHAYFKVRNANKPAELEALQRNPEKKLADTGLAEALLDAERALLYTLHFNVRDYHIQQALKLYLAAADVYTLAPPPAQPPANPVNTISMKDQTQITNVAIRLAKDIFKTQLVCQMPPEPAAAACAHLAAELSKVQLNAPSDEILLSTEHKLSLAYKLSDSDFQSFKSQIMELFTSVKKSEPAEATGGQPASTAAVTPNSKPAAPTQGLTPAARMAFKPPPPPAFRPGSGPQGAAPVQENGVDVGSPSDPNARSLNDDQNNNNNTTPACEEVSGAQVQPAVSAEPGEIVHQPAQPAQTQGPPEHLQEPAPVPGSQQGPGQASSYGAQGPHAAVPMALGQGCSGAALRGGEVTGPLNGYIQPRASRKRSAEDDESGQREAKVLRVA